MTGKIEKNEIFFRENLEFIPENVDSFLELVLREIPSVIPEGIHLKGKYLRVSLPQKFAKNNSCIVALKQ